MQNSSPSSKLDDILRELEEKFQIDKTDSAHSHEGNSKKNPPFTAQLGLSFAALMIMVVGAAASLVLMNQSQEIRQRAQVAYTCPTNQTCVPNASTCVENGGSIQGTCEGAVGVSNVCCILPNQCIPTGGDGCNVNQDCCDEGNAVCDIPTGRCRERRCSERGDGATCNTLGSVCPPGSFESGVCGDSSGIIVGICCVPSVVITNTPTRTPTNTPGTGGPTATPIQPTDIPVNPTNTPIVLIPTNTPVIPTNTPVAPTNTPIPTATATRTPTNTPGTGGPTPTNTPRPTNTPVPTATATLPPGVTPSSTPQLTATNTPVPTQTATVQPTNTPQPGQPNPPKAGGTGSTFVIITTVVAILVLGTLGLLLLL